MAKTFLTVILCVVWLPVLAATLDGVRVHESPEATRIVLDTSAGVKYKYFTLDKPHRVVIDLATATPA